MVNSVRREVDQEGDVVVRKVVIDMEEEPVESVLEEGPEEASDSPAHSGVGESLRGREGDRASLSREDGGEEGGRGHVDGLW